MTVSLTTSYHFTSIHDILSNTEKHCEVLTSLF